MACRRCRSDGIESAEAKRRMRDARHAIGIGIDAPAANVCPRAHCRNSYVDMRVAARSRCILRTGVVILYLWWFACPFSKRFREGRPTDLSHAGTPSGAPRTTHLRLPGTALKYVTVGAILLLFCERYLVGMCLCTATLHIDVRLHV